jgi:hypothetical protein
MREMELILEESGGGLRVELWYQVDRFSHSRANGWLRRYAEMLTRLALAPDVLAEPVSSLFPRAGGGASIGVSA